MKFKAGQKAVVKHSCFDVNIGKVVTLLKPQEEEDDYYLDDIPEGVVGWRVRCEEYLYSATADNRRWFVRNETVLPDCVLSPLDE